MEDIDEKYMKTALKMARRGIGSVEPNPAVGCVIAKANQMVGRAWHKKFGGPHAEINALDDCKTLGVNPKGATMYVTLEPCCHQAKTGPCTDAIIDAGLSRVVVATIDPSQHANGKGIEQLRSAGIDVRTGVCQTEARLVNGPFIKFASTGKCWVTLKWAQSIDGKVTWSDETGQRRHISSELSRKDAHKLRQRAGAILVGINTVLADNPLLTARPGRKDRKLTRIVLDSKLRLPTDCRLLSTSKKAPVVIVTSQATVESNPQAAEAITNKEAELLVFGDTPGRSNLPFLLEQLSNRGISHLLVEGGPTVISSFLKEGLADEVCVYIAPKILGWQGNINISDSLADFSEAAELHYVNIEIFGDDVCVRGLTKKVVEELSLSED